MHFTLTCRDENFSTLTLERLGISDTIRVRRLVGPSFELPVLLRALRQDAR